MARRFRLVGAFGAIAALTVSGLVLGGSAGADTENGQLLGKVQGSALGTSTDLFSASTDKKPAVFTLAVKNTGDVQTQYLFGMTIPSGNAMWTWSTGKTRIARSYFWSPAVDPGQVATVTVQAATSGPNVDVDEALVDVSVPNTGLYLGTYNLRVTEQQPFTGTAPGDLFLKTGSLPWVAGVAPYPAEDSAAVAPRKSVKFSLRIQNDTAATASVPLLFYRVTGASACTSADFPITFKQGSKDVTAAMLAGTFAPQLDPGKSTTLSYEVSYPAAVPDCAGVGTTLYEPTTGGQSVVMVVPTAG